MSQYRVLVTDPLSEAGLNILSQNPAVEVVDVSDSKLSVEELRQALSDVDGAVIRSGVKLTKDVLTGQKRLKAIARAGVGVDNVDLDAATREGIIVMNTPGGNTTSTAEHAFALMMALSRNVPQAVAVMRSGGWDRNKFKGSQLSGKTLAVIGLGRIGISVAKRAIAFEMNVIGYDPFLSEDRAKEYGITLYREVDDLIDKCDFISVHTPLTDETRNLINAERIERMRPGVRVINCARGGIVNEADVIAAVQSGKLAGAAFDVYPSEPPAEDDPIRSVPNIITTPHLGASTEEAQEAVAIEAVEIMVGFLIEKEVKHAINMAPISGAELGEARRYLDLGYRLGLLHSQLLEQRFKSAGLKEVRISYRGEVASKKTRLISQAFMAGLLSSGKGEPVNIINSKMIAQERGIHVVESTEEEAGDFTSLVKTTLVTDHGEFTAAGTIFGDKFLRLVKLDGFPLEAYLDGQMLIYRHEDKPGLIGFIGTVCGQHDVNISHMALGRQQSGGDSVAVLNVDSTPSDEVRQEIAGHLHVTGVDLVSLPKAGAPLPWLDSQS
jgi:D-3-phosphoglycerate dehydrogenase